MLWARAECTPGKRKDSSLTNEWYGPCKAGQGFSAFYLIYKYCLGNFTWYWYLQYLLIATTSENGWQPFNAGV